MVSYWAIFFASLIFWAITVFLVVVIWKIFKKYWTKFLLKMRFRKKVFDPKVEALCENAIEQNIGKTGLQAMLLKHGTPKAKMEETLYCFDQIQKQKLKGGDGQ